MGSEISGLDDRHAYLKLGNNVARFDFDYLDLPTSTPGFLPRQFPDGELSFDPDTLKPRRPNTRPNSAGPFAEPSSGAGAPLAHKREPDMASAEQIFQPEESRIGKFSTASAELEPEADSEKHRPDRSSRLVRRASPRGAFGDLLAYASPFPNRLSSSQAQSYTHPHAPLRYDGS